eukprot:SAG11_NODE_218_length_12212_cov_7.026005_9_plen_80_part_00
MAVGPSSMMRGFGGVSVCPFKITALRSLCPSYDKGSGPNAAAVVREHKRVVVERRQLWGNPAGREQHRRTVAHCQDVAG